MSTEKSEPPQKFNTVMSSNIKFRLLNNYLITTTFYSTKKYN